MRKMGLFVFLFILFSLIGGYPVGVQASDVRFTTYLLDEADLLPAHAAGELNSLLAQFEEETGNQFLVAVLPALPPNENLENYGLRVAEKARAGQKGKDNGLLILISLDDRAIRIEVGTGLEGQITDGRAGRVIREVLAPAFQEENYAGGIKAALLTLMYWVEPSFAPAATAGDRLEDDEGMGALLYLLLFIGLSLISAASARWERRRLYKRGYSQRSPGPIFFPPPSRPFNPPSGSFPRIGRGGFGGGGFRGGGGGFRGGGASGGW